MQKTILTIVAVALVGCASPAFISDPSNPQNVIVEKAIRETLKKPKGELTKTDLVKVFSLNLANDHITDEGLKQVATLKNLTRLSLEHCKQYTDVGLKEVAKLKSLTYLQLDYAKITDVGLKEVAKLNNLTDGGGAHVGAYLNALRDTDACNAVVLADPDGKWANEASKVLGNKLKGTYRDHKQMLEREKPVMSVVTMEAALAPPVIDLALEHGCHVFAEKPACLRAEDFAPLIKKADGKKLHVMLALANRLNPELIAARKLISEGAIGKVYGLEMNLVADQTRLTRESYRKQWYAQKKRAGGGHLIWLGIHWLDLVQHVTGSSITEAVGFTANVGGQPIDVEDSAAAILKFDNGTLGTVTSGYYLKRGYHSRIKVWGSEGWLHLEQMKDKPLHWVSQKGDQADKNPPKLRYVIKEKE